MTRLVNKDPKKVEAVIKADPEALALFREAMKCVNQSDAPRPLGDNVTKREGQRETGNSRAYSITRVQKECDEETVKDVMAGKVSANTAINIDSLGTLAVSVVLFAWCRFWSAVQRTPQPQPL